jgi:hypothetical protein
LIGGRPTAVRHNFGHAPPCSNIPATPRLGQDGSKVWRNVLLVQSTCTSDDLGGVAPAISPVGCLATHVKPLPLRLGLAVFVRCRGFADFHLLRVSQTEHKGMFKTFHQARVTKRDCHSDNSQHVIATLLKQTPLRHTSSVYNLSSGGVRVAPRK